MTQRNATYHNPERKQRSIGQRQRLIDLYKIHDTQGLTIKEAAKHTGLPESTITARNSENRKGGFYRRHG